MTHVIDSGVDEIGLNDIVPVREYDEHGNAVREIKKLNGKFYINGKELKKGDE